MYRNKKKYFLLLGITLTFVLTACASSDKLMTDTGSGSYKEIDKTEYLDEEALNRPKDEGYTGSYKVYTLEKGTFSEKALNQTLNRAYINVPTVKLEIEEGTVQFVGYEAGNMFDYVKVGDPIATVKTEIDELTVEEEELKLTRLQERYARDEAKLNEDLEELRVDRTLIYNDYERFVIDVRCEQLKLDWEKTKRSYEKAIADTGERLDTLKKSRDTTVISAPIEGYAIYSHKYMTGVELEDGDYICNILANDNFYVQTSNQADKLPYGMSVKLRSVTDVVDATIISAGCRALYGNLDKGEATMTVDFGEDTLPASIMQVRSLVMEGDIQTVENVLIVPKQAVTTEGENYFVTVLNKDGSLLKTEFIPGGSNAESYWVYEGLEEGMQIVY